MKGVFIPLRFHNIIIDLESQGYADDEDALVNDLFQNGLLREVWIIYNGASNSKMNESKLRILPLTPLSTETEDWRRNYTLQSREFKIVGFPIRADGQAPITTLHNLLCKVRKRAGFWSQCNLSLLGRVNVANSLLTSKVQTHLPPTSSPL